MREDGKYRILLADDDHGLCAVLQAYLDLQPDLCCCAVAYNGLHALEKTRQQSTASRQPVALRSSASADFNSKQLKNPETMRFSGFFLFRLFALFWRSLTRFEPFFMG